MSEFAKVLAVAAKALGEQLLQLSSLHKAFGDHVLFDNVNWHIKAGDCIGLCGPNGAGKTTLLNMIAGEEEPDRGTLSRPNDLTIGYLPQDGLTHAGRTLFEEASTAFDSLLSLQGEMHALEERLGDVGTSATEHDRLLARYSTVQDTFRDQEGYRIDAKVSGVLGGLGFAPGDLERPTETFSGGWQMRIALAKLLLCRPHLLLLDEPTNHLDLEARNWLEEFLVAYPHAVVLVSHDRFFLDSVVTAIAEISLKTLTAYPGNYSAYLVERQARIERLMEEKRRQDEEITRVRVFIERFRYKATKARQVQSRLRMLKKITPIAVPPERKRAHFTFPGSPTSGRMVIELCDASKAYGAVQVFNRVNVHIARGDRLALVGSNGAGKSTLMRLLAGVEAPDRGVRTVGHQVVMQYFAQDEATRLDGSLTVYETLASGSPVDMIPAIRNILGGFLFTQDDIYKRVSVLSGGERTRLAVARMLLSPSNTLLLDEPTNHLDIDSTDVLLNALTDYGGTLIFVSHDRYFVDQLATHVLAISNGDAALYPGTYEEFRWSIRSLATAGTTEEIEPPASEPPPPAPSAAAYKRRQVEVNRRRRRLDALHTRIAELERRIEEREQTIRELEVLMAKEGFYANAQAAQEVIQRHQSLMWEVGDLMNQWEALEREASADTKSGVE